MLRSKFVACLVGAIAAGALSVSPASGSSPAGEEGQGSEFRRPYIVVLEEGTEPRGLAKRLAVTPDHVYEAAFAGFSSLLTDKQVDVLSQDLAVSAVIADVATFEIDDRRSDSFRVMDRTDNRRGAESCYFIVCQHIPVNMQRVDAIRSRTADIDWRDDARVDADIAIIDSGVRPHPDINLVGSTYCGPGQSAAVPDEHGTEAAGVAAMIDDTNGLVGSAPGARIWSVQVANTATGTITSASILCAVDWVVANSDVIEVANMSLGAPEAEIGNCGVDRKGRVADPLHFSICRAVDLGVTFTVSAGNDSKDAANQIPASYDEVITVSAYVDYDGEPGGKYPESRCYWVYFGDEEDDTFAYWSNYGPDVDITAPGDCVLTSFGTDETYFRVVSGTSFSAPAVAGAAALLYADDPSITPDEVRAALIANGEKVVMLDDPDGINEPLLNLKGL